MEATIEHEIPEPQAGPAAEATSVRAVRREQRHRRGWARALALDSLYLLLGLPMGILMFTIVTAGWGTAIGSFITFIGVPVALLTIAATRGVAHVERRRAELVLGEPVPAVYAGRLPLHRDDWRELRAIWERIKLIVLDRQTWKDLGYGLLSIITGTVGFTIVVAGWSTALALLTAPAWWWAAGDSADVDLGSLHIRDSGAVDIGSWHIDSWGVAGASFVVGLILLPLVALLVHGAAHVGAALTSGLLGPGKRQLEERVEHLEETRAGAVDAARLELERIERDLHDGAQARIVAVAMELGRAEQKLAAGDQEDAAQLVREAREETQRALAELRDLARGIRPALLSERGLQEAITSLAGRAGVPATIEYHVSGRLTAAIETAAYFVTAEALANIAKHAQATSAAVRVERRAGRLEVEIRDDGAGGADPSGSGLTGLRKRVEALDGTLLISSPSDGPTILRAELPCA